jgi:hypothetical protein
MALCAAIVVVDLADVRAGPAWRTVKTLVNTRGPRLRIERARGAIRRRAARFRAVAPKRAFVALRADRQSGLRAAECPRRARVLGDAGGAFEAVVALRTRLRLRAPGGAVRASGADSADVRALLSCGWVVRPRWTRVLRRALGAFRTEEPCRAWLSRQGRRPHLTVHALWTRRARVINALRAVQNRLVER